MPKKKEPVNSVKPGGYVPPCLRNNNVELNAVREMINATKNIRQNPSSLYQPKPNTTLKPQQMINNFNQLSSFPLPLIITPQPTTVLNNLSSMSSSTSSINIQKSRISTDTKNINQMNGKPPKIESLTAFIPLQTNNNSCTSEEVNILLEINSRLTNLGDKEMAKNISEDFSKQLIHYIGNIATVDILVVRQVFNFTQTIIDRIESGFDVDFGINFLVFFTQSDFLRRKMPEYLCHLDDMEDNDVANILLLFLKTSNYLSSIYSQMCEINIKVFLYNLREITRKFISVNRQNSTWNDITLIQQLDSLLISLIEHTSFLPEEKSRKYVDNKPHQLNNGFRPDSQKNSISSPISQLSSTNNQVELDNDGADLSACSRVSEVGSEISSEKLSASDSEYRKQMWSEQRYLVYLQTILAKEKLKRLGLEVPPPLPGQSDASDIS